MNERRAATLTNAPPPPTGAMSAMVHRARERRIERAETVARRLGWLPAVPERDEDGRESVRAVGPGDGPDAT